MAASVTQYAEVANWFDATTPHSVTGLAWSTGDVIVVVGGAEDGANDLGAPTNANLTFTQRALADTGTGESVIGIWTAVAGSNQTGQTVAQARTAGIDQFGHSVHVISGASGSFANASADMTESAFTFTPTAGSVVIYGHTDWAATTGKTITTGTGTATERTDNGNGTNYGNYRGDWANVTASSASFGITSYTGTQVTRAVIEVLASTGTTDTSVNPLRLQPKIIGNPFIGDIGRGFGPNVTTFPRQPAIPMVLWNDTEIAASGTSYPVAQTDSAGLTDSTILDRSLVFTDSAGLTDTTALERSLVVTDSTGLTDTTALTVAPVFTDSIGLTDTTTVELAKTVTQTDSAGLTDTVLLEQQKVFTDSTGLTDTTPVTRSLVITDSAGLTDTSTVELAKTVSQTDDAGLTDSTLLTRLLAYTDSAGLTDTAILDRALVYTDSAGLTDTSAVSSGKILDLSDNAGLTDTTALTRGLTPTDDAGLTDTTALARALVLTDSAGLTDTSTVGLQKDLAVTDSAGLTDTRIFARTIGLDDLVGLTDATAQSRSLIHTDSAGLTDTFTADLIAPVIIADGHIYGGRRTTADISGGQRSRVDITGGQRATTAELVGAPR